MNDLINRFQTCDIASSHISEALKYDVSYIIYCYEYDIFLDTSIFKIEKHAQGSVPELYQDILKILATRSYTCHTIDIMPLIDEYLEYYDGL